MRSAIRTKSFAPPGSPHVPSRRATERGDIPSARGRAGVLEDLEVAWERELQELLAKDLDRSLTSVEAIRGPIVELNHRQVVTWCTNDYLGLSVHPRVIEAACEAARRWGVGARASRLLGGSTRLHEELEATLAAFFGGEAAAVYPTGYQANLGTLSVLAGPEDLVLLDRLAHASLIDACRATRATFRVFRHNDVEHLTALLSRAKGRGRRLIVTEGVFSMDGDLAPLAELHRLARAHGALLYVDDAHGACAIGRTGRGSPEWHGIPHEGLIYVGTLGKALGAQGGFVVAPRRLIRIIHNRARTFMYTTGLACPMVAAALEALRIIQGDATPREQLLRNGQQLQERMCQRTQDPRDATQGIVPGVARSAAPPSRCATLLEPRKFRFASRSETKRAGRNAGRANARPSPAMSEPARSGHIVPVVVGSTARARELSQQLWERGMLAPAIRPPTVPEGTARLRISVTALHTPTQITALADALDDCR